MELLNELPSLLKAFWYIAIPASLIFIFQTIATFVGADSSDGVSADFDSNLEGTEAPFQLFSVRNLINFLLGFSWSGISFYSSISNPALLIIIAFITGLLFVLLFFIIIKQLLKLAEDNSFKMDDCLNQLAEVYIPVPAKRSGTGRVLISIKGSVHELDAMTDAERIESGKPVKVIRVENKHMLIIEPI
jgi:hypothetical protein